MITRFRATSDLSFELEPCGELWRATIRQFTPDGEKTVESICGKPYRAMGKAVEELQRMIDEQARQSNEERDR